MRKTFIVEMWERIFFFLSFLSFYRLLAAVFKPAKSPWFVDAWVLGNTILSIVSVSIVAKFEQAWLCWLLVVYGILRVFEIAVYQANVLLFDEFRAERAGRRYYLTGYRRMILLLLHNYVEIIFWLASTYIMFASEFTYKWDAGRDSTLGAIYSSFITMTTFGDFDLLPRGNFAAAILIFHSTVGLFMTLLSLARFISLLPVPRALDSYKPKFDVDLDAELNASKSHHSEL